MKIQLVPKGDVTVLQVSGPVDMRTFEVLKAGIKKIFRDGKNKIILNLKDTEKLDGDVIREIAILDILARELSGRIAVSGLSDEVKQNVTTFSKPPIVPIFSTDEQAVEFFSQSAADAEDLPDDLDELKKMVSQKTKEIEALRSQLELRNPEGLTKLREENAELVGFNRQLEKQVQDLLKERRLPPDKEAFEQKIAILEARVKEMVRPS